MNLNKKADLSGAKDLISHSLSLHSLCRAEGRFCYSLACIFWIWFKLIRLFRTSTCYCCMAGRHPWWLIWFSLSSSCKWEALPHLRLFSLTLHMVLYHQAGSHVRVPPLVMIKAESIARHSIFNVMEFSNLFFGCFR